MNEHDTTIVNLIMAADDAGGIGFMGCLPWQDPADLKWFKKMTMHGMVVVGYNTARKLPELPGRIVKVMDRDTNPNQILSDRNEHYPTKEIWVAGGAKTYIRWLPYVDRFFVSHIDGTFLVDTYSPIPLPWVHKLK